MNKASAEINEIIQNYITSIAPYFKENNPFALTEQYLVTSDQIDVRNASPIEGYQGMKGVITKYEQQYKDIILTLKDLLNRGDISNHVFQTERNHISECFFNTFGYYPAGVAHKKMPPLRLH